MKIETLGHASLLISDDNNQPILLTDPWVIGSAYWRSWWLQNYPTAKRLEELQQLEYCYITHEHPDHFHTASIRKLSSKIKFISPQLPQEKISLFLNETGKNSEVIPLLKWKKLNEEISILSIPLYNDDSVLLINTKTSFIVNFNDAKPSTAQVKSISDFIKKYGNSKKVILLSSYSPASIVNSFLRGGERLSIKSKKEYVNYICKNCNLLKPDYFIPFASQVIFYRSDSKWANKFKVSVEDLQEHWDSNTQLLNPFSSIDLNSFSNDFILPKNYNSAQNNGIQDKIDKQESLDIEADFDDTDISKLKKKLSANRFIFSLLFSKGIGFFVAGKTITYYPITNKLVESAKEKPVFTLIIPCQALKDVLNYGHFGDLGITMFTLIQLNNKVNPKIIYLFFILITLHDYGHTATFSNFYKWLKQIIWLRSWKIPPPI